MAKELVDHTEDNDSDKSQFSFFERAGRGSSRFSFSGIKDLAYDASIVLACSGVGLGSGVLISEHMSALVQVPHFSTPTNSLFYGATVTVTTGIGFISGIVEAHQERRKRNRSIS